MTLRALLLGLDIGTTATKCVLVDPGQGIVAEAARPVALASAQAGWAEEDPATWWRNACELIPEVQAAAGRAGGDVRGIGVSGMAPALVCLDEAGRPLRPSIQQNDARAADEVAALRHALAGAQPPGAQRQLPYRGLTHPPAAVTRSLTPQPLSLIVYPIRTAWFESLAKPSARTR